jgi:hypothetical protein
MVRRSQVPGIDQEIDVHKDHLFVRLPFGLSEYFPSVVQMREIAFPQIDRLGSKWSLRNKGVRHAFEAMAQRFVHNRLQRRISRFLNLLEKGCDIVIQT